MSVLPISNGKPHIESDDIKEINKCDMQINALVGKLSKINKK